MPVPGSRSATWSANMSSNSRNVKLTTRCHYWGIDLPVDLLLDLPIWALIVEMLNHHSWTLEPSTRRVRSATWSANMSSNSRNVKLLFLTTRCHYWWLELPVDLPLHLPIWPLTVEMWNFYSWPLDATTEEVDLPVDLPIWALTVEM